VKRNRGADNAAVNFGHFCEARPLSFEPDELKNTSKLFILLLLDIKGSTPLINRRES
jgi:hypothetical protein